MTPALSVVVPVCNEAENVEPLVREIHAAVGALSYEMIFIDDGSTDDTAGILKRLKAEFPALRVLHHSFRSGQSAAVASGVRAARAPWIATLDGDGQNDPADIPRLVTERDAPANRGVQLFMGNRKASRKDTAFRKLQSSIANGVRSGLLGDGTPDTGCGIKLFSREVFMELPRFDHMHRFLPALFLRQGARVISVPVSHRARLRGTSKYGMLNRLWVGIVDICGVMWLRRRYKPGLLVREE
ncbi:MAG TPA: glycosyltransferase family 2 protein [Steroidobacteraceae bacterium]|nr:glycosyltransferase family 2 protein [Steroidobacteraceae bacterium]